MLPPSTSGVDGLPGSEKLAQRSAQPTAVNADVEVDGLFMTVESFAAPNFDKVASIFFYIIPILPLYTVL